MGLFSGYTLSCHDALPYFQNLRRIGQYAKELAQGRDFISRPGDRHSQSIFSPRPGGNSPELYKVLGRNAERLVLQSQSRQGILSRGVSGWSGCRERSRIFVSMRTTAYRPRSR